MSGFITERHFEEAEAAFPGIQRFYRALGNKPATFLDLMRMFLEAGEPNELEAELA
jgi:hypothetical protein